MPIGVSINSLLEPPRCPVVQEVQRARERAEQLGITSMKGVLLYVAERLEVYANHRAAREDNLSWVFRDAAAQCVAIARMEP